jgi:hypothetical protein
MKPELIRISGLPRFYFWAQMLGLERAILIGAASRH